MESFAPMEVQAARWLKDERRPDVRAKTELPTSNDHSL
jgi:hypothetical protein